MSPANGIALRFIKADLRPVLLGSEGDALKRPLPTGWQTAVYTAADVSTWPLHHNIGLRCGLQRDGLPEQTTWPQAQVGEGAC